MDILDNISYILSNPEDEQEIWMELQYFRDHKHCEDIYAKMMRDKSLEPIGKEFFGLITQGKRLITGGFNRLRE